MTRVSERSQHRYSANHEEYGGKRGCLGENTQVCDPSSRVKPTPPPQTLLSINLALN
ncbi:hypothetical protein [Providencia rettgeri]|uniref:hypothetical protein n=1 Tax=Providencia rettgeri TaxID=587 RepID=UPI0023629883|nr:hypothetical protein [Providencia rettgeri]